MLHQDNFHAEMQHADSDSIGNDPEDLEFLRAEPEGIVSTNLKPTQRLQRLDVVCIICNRTIGMLWSQYCKSSVISVHVLILSHSLIRDGSDFIFKGHSLYCRL